MKPGPGWKHVGGAVFDHDDGTRVHILGLCRQADGRRVNGVIWPTSKTVEIIVRINEASKTFTDLESEQREYLQYFTLICSLAFDVYIKKHLIESLIDNIKEPEIPKETSKQDKANKSKA